MYLSHPVCLFTGPPYTITTGVTSSHGNGVLLVLGSQGWQCCLEKPAPVPVTAALPNGFKCGSVHQAPLVAAFLWAKPQTAEPLIYSAVQGPLNNSLYGSLFAQPPCRRKHKGKSALQEMLMQVSLPWPDQQSMRIYKLQIHCSSTGLLWRFHSCTGNQRTAACVSQNRTILLLPEPH